MKIKNKKNVLIFLLIVLIIILIRISGIHKFFTLKSFIENREHLLMIVNENYFFALILFFIGYILTVVSTLPLSGVLTVVGGFLFGAIPGTIYAVFAGTIGCIFSFLIFRYLLGRTVQEKYGAKLEKFNKNIDYYGSSYILMLQLVGVVPFFVVNILAALTNIKLRTFIWTTFVGIIPINFIYAYAGRQLGTINALSEIFSARVILAISLLALLSLIPIIVKKIKGSKAI